MKIGVVSNLYPPFSIGGYEQLCAKVCDELAALGHEIVVLTSTYGGPAPDIESQLVERRLKLQANEDDIYRPFSSSSSEIDAINQYNRLELSAFHERHKPDIWFAWNLYFLGDVFHDELSTFGKPVVLFLTDNWLIAAQKPDAVGRFFAQHVHGSEPFVPNVGMIRGQSLLKQRAIFGSRFIRDFYISSGFTFSDQVVIHNGVALPIVPPEFFVRRSEPREAGRLKLLFAGRLVDIKGPQLIVAALPLIRELASGQVSLTIVGDTQDRTFISKLRAEIDASDCADLITFRDQVSEALLLPLFNDHDIYIFPSLYEPFSLTLIHALGAGIPTIATDIGGNSEIVKHGESGLLFDKSSPSELANAVLRVAGDGRLRTNLSKNGRHVAARFTFRRMITRIENELKKANS